MKPGDGFEFSDPSAYIPLSLDQRQQAVFKMCPKARKLRDLLLKQGGARVIWHIRDQHIAEILEQGRTFDTPARLIDGGEKSACHQNVAMLFLQDQGVPVTGYALSDDGYWRQHSWAWNEREVLETTKLRSAYFGFMPAPLKFALSQVGPTGLEKFLASTDQKNLDRLQRYIPNP